MINYYQILGLEKNVSKDEIKKAFRLYATKFHPDKQSGDKFFEERFKEIYAAYETLSDNTKRREYDLVFDNDSNKINKSDLIYKDIIEKEKVLLQKEKDLKIKEAVINSEKSHFDKSERLRKEFELSKIIYYKDNQIIVSGINLQIDNEKYSFNDYIDIKSSKINRPKIKLSDKSKSIYGLATISIIIGMFTIGFVIGILLIIIGFIILIFVVFSNIFGFFYNFTIDTIYPRYQLILLGKSINKPIIEGNRYRISKIEKKLKNALEKYYITK